jgi:hypothetical protein
MTNRPGIPDHAAPEPRYEVLPSNKTEPKVKAATAGAGAGSVITTFSIWVIDELWYSGESPPEVPFAVVALVGLAVTTGLTYAAGFFARHVNRAE